MSLQEILFLSAATIYFFAGMLNLLFPKLSGANNSGIIILVCGWVIHLAGLILWTIRSGHVPLSGIYESMIFFSWCVVGVACFSAIRQKIPGVMAVSALIAFLAIGAASVLPEGLRTMKPLVPVLRSVWLVIHVICCFIGYAAFTLAAGSSAIFLFRSVFKRAPGELEGMEKYDKLTYRSIGTGFPFLSIGIVTGAIWANYAWGSYWSWDPKETWALITWLTYAVFLHLRLIRKKEGIWQHWFSLLGFFVMLFTYFGVNFLMRGLHSYK